MYSALRRFSVATLFLCVGFAWKASPAQSVPSASAHEFLAQHPALRIPVQANRVPAYPNFNVLTRGQGHVAPYVKSAARTGSPDMGAALRLTALLSRSAETQAAFEQLLKNQQDPGSPLYHVWLTPSQVGELYGPTQSDVDAVVSWLQMSGFEVDSVDPSRTRIHFTTTFGRAANAFQTSFGQFSVRDQTIYSVTEEPSLPASLTGVLSAIVGLSEVPVYKHSHNTGSFPLASLNSIAKPNFTFTSGSATSHYIAPGDFNVIYDVQQTLNSGITGTNQTIAIIGQSRVTASDITNYETIFGLPIHQPNTIIPTNGTDPMVASDTDEQTLDVERAIGVAPGATIDLIVSGATQSDNGLDIAIDWNVNSRVDKIMSISYGTCEADYNAAQSASDESFFSQAASEGITILASSGDSGAQGCLGIDSKFASGVYISGLCASAYVTCVGGTEFAEGSSSSSFWSASNNSTTLTSALSYIPEGAWNDPTTINSRGATVYQAAATGGGVSLYVAKPTWQTGAGVPTDGKRDVPDISFSSSADHDGYLICLSPTTNCAASGSTGASFAVFGGTSAAAPGMAGIVALLNQRTSNTSGYGLLNPVLYGLATSSPTSFHDVTLSSSGVGSACTAATPSLCNNSTPGSSSLSGGTTGYIITNGYDPVTGLGSLDVTNFLTAVSNKPAPTTLAVASSANPAITNQPTTLTATLTFSNSTNNPTGNVQFYSGTTAIGSPVAISNGTAALSYTFTTAGTFSITAVYAGDSHFSTSTSPAISLVVNPAGFTVSASSTTLNVVSGATTGNTDTITVQSSTLSGTATLGCTMINSTGNAAGSCSFLPTTVAVTTTTSGTSTLSLATTPGTSGTLTFSVTGTLGGITAASLPITVNVTAPSFTMTASPATASVLSGGTTTSTITIKPVNGFVGTVNLTCSAGPVSGTTSTATGTCSATPASVLVPAVATQPITTNLSIVSTAGTNGALLATVTGTGMTSGSSIAAISTTAVTVTVNPLFTMSSANLTVTHGATTGNTDAITLTAATGFSGTVALTCAVTPSTGVPPTCSMSPASITATSGGTSTSTATITTQASSSTCTSSMAAPAPWGRGVGGTVFAAFALVLIPFRKRKAVRNLLVFCVLIGGLTWLSGCGSGSSTSVPCAVTAQSGTTTGTYTVTVTGTSSGTTAATSFTLTVN